MNPLSTIFPVSARVLLLLSCLWISACRENSRQADAVDTEAKPTVTEQEEGRPDESITALQREIEEGRQNIENIEAFVEMERAKLEENPDYEQAFMLEALEEQEAARKKVEADERRLRELMPGKE
jgi:DNA-directed RNA polymerase specialized sigma24 family protein